MGSPALNVSISADASRLNAGLAEAQLKVRQASEEMTAAWKAFGAASAAGNEQAQQALIGYQTRLNEAREAVKTLGSAEREEQEVVRSSISTRMAASAELRVLEGNLMGSTRAAGAFLSTLPGIGAAMQVAFPLFGALALVEILATMTEKVVKLTEDWGALQKIQDEALNEMAKGEQAAISISEQHLRITRDLQVARAELTSGKLGRGAAGAAAGDAFDVSVATNNLAILQGQIKATQESYDELTKRAAATETVHARHGEAVTGPTEDAKVAATQLGKVYQDLANQEAQAQNLRDEIQAKQTQGAVRQKELSEDAAETAERASKKIQKALSDQVEVMLRTDALAVEGAKRVTAGVNEYGAELIRQDKEISEAAEESAKKQQEADREAARAAERLNEELTKGAEIQSQTSASIAEASIHFQVATGAMTELGAAHALAAIHADEYAQKLAALRTQLDQVGGDPAKSQSIQNQIAQVKGQAQTSAISDQTVIAQQTSSPWITAANQVTDAWIGAFNKILVGGRDSWHAVAQAGEQMTMALIGDAEKYLQRKLEQYVLEKVFHVQTEASKVAATTSANAATQASTSATNVSEALSYAAVAAAGAAASVAAIPGVGWALAPAVAAETFATTSVYAGIAAFDTGGIIPKDGIIMAHEKEAVLPERLTSFLMGAAGGQTGQAQPGLRDINFQQTFHGGGNGRQGASLRDFAKVLRNANLIT